MGLLQFSTLVNLYFASFFRRVRFLIFTGLIGFWNSPFSLISVSLGTALLPTLSVLSNQGAKEKFQETAQESFLMNIFWRGLRL